MPRLAWAVLCVGVTVTAQTIAQLPKPPQVQGNCVEAGGVPQSPPDPASFGQKDYVELSRSSCFGHCPDYRVRIYRSGRVEWEGRSDVEEVGPASGHADPSFVAEIFAEAASTKFWAACDSYRRRRFDQPTYSLTVGIGREKKSIEDYAQGGPEWVRELMQKIDQVAGSKKWGGPDWHPI